MAELYPAPKFKWFKDDGTVASGYKVFTYEPGSSTKKATYTSIAATSENANPVVLDSRGEASIYFDGSYKIVVATPTDTDPPVGTVTTIDNYRSGTSTSTGGGGNLIDNGGFETLFAGSATLPDGWNVVQTGTVAVDNSTQSEGEYSLKFTSTGSGGGTATSSSFVAVDVNRKYVLRLTMKTGATVNAANKAQIIWYTSTQTVISTSNYLSDTTARTSFTALEYRVTPVATAAYFKVVLTGVDTSGASGTETTWFDNVKVVDAESFATLSDTSTIALTTHASNVLTLNSSALTANRSLTFPDAAGEVMITGDAVIADVSDFPTVGSNGGKILKVNSGGTAFEVTTIPAFRAYLSSAQSIAASTYTKIQAATEQYDTNSNYDPTTNYRFTPTVAGYYWFSVAANLVNMVSGKAATTSLRKNGSDFAYEVVGSNGSVSTTTRVVALVYMNGSTDYVEGYVHHDDTVSRTISASSIYAFEGFLIKAD